jgi:imidazolonepropionase
MSTPFNRTRSLWLNARLATMDTQHPAPYGALHDHMLVVEQAVLPPSCRKAS